MKKLTALFLALALTLTFAACTAKPEPEIEEAPVAEEPVTEEEPEPGEKEIPPVKAAVFWYDFRDAFLSTVRTALDEDLTEAGIEFTNYDAERQQARQNDDIETAISEGANLLIVNIVNTAEVDDMQWVCDRAKEADIPVIFFNREVEDSVINSYENAAYVGTRFAESGEKQGILAGNYLVPHFDEVDLNGDGVISYILMKGELGIEVEARTIFPVSFCNDALTKAGYPEIEYYDPNNTDKFEPANWSRTTAFDIMTAALGKFPMDGENPIEMALCNNDDTAIGVIEALNDVGWNTGDGPSIPVFGIDYTWEGQQAIEAGKMTGSILQSAEGMAKTVTELAKNVQAGKNVFEGARKIYNVDEAANKIRVPYEIKTKDNI